MGIRGQYKNKTCRACGCSEPVKARGFCLRHYARLNRKGSIEVNSKSSKGMDFLRGLCGGTADDCVIWPFRISMYGYPILSWRGKSYRANRVVCRLAHGKPESVQMHAAHSCGNSSCVNPSHIRWATAKENISDKRDHGTHFLGARVHNAILDEADVLQILKKLKAGETCASIGREFGVSRAAISKIKSGKNWGHISGD